MTETTSGSGTLTRTRKQPDTPHPHYFSSFQNYCCGPKAKTNSSPSNKDFLPIPEKFKIRVDEILSFINGLLIERIPRLTKYTSVLPFEFFEQDRILDSQRYLVDRTMFKMMQDARVINWVPSLKKLYPIRTSGNGNCLLHAVLIAMVGVHDFNLHLRDRLHQFMDKNKEVLKGNWKAERLKTDKIYGIQSEDSKLDSEWEELCDLVRYENSDDGQAASNLQFLEAVHIFSISNMLARPIIILSEDVVRNKHGEAISYNDLFGIYLPILTRPDDCVSLPIVLAYDQSHFCPLQTSDAETGTSSDNYLPLYQSLEHTRKQTLLPIRFLGNDASEENTNRLLQNYLHIKKLAHYPDSNSSSVTILCAELGITHLKDKDDFFLLYYKYIQDFFETQKSKIHDEEEEEKRRREQEYNFHNQTLYDTNQRPLMKTGTSSPPPPYSSLSIRSNDNKSTLNNERRPSYDKAVTNGTSYGLSNDSNRPMNQYSEVQQIQKPQNNIQIMQRSPYTNDNYYSNEKQYQTPLSDWEPLNNEPISNGKIINTNNTSSRGSDSKFKQEQQQNSVRIPVQFIKFDPPSNLIDFEQKTDRIRPCIVCKHYFNDLSSTGLCSQCDYNKKPSPPRHVVITRSPPINTYSTTYKSSDFLTPLSSSSKIRGPVKITCPHCRFLNMVNGMQNKTDYTCSICKATLHIPRY